MDVKDVIRKYITTGNPVEISEEDYFQLRREVANEFDLHPSEVIIVGSCRTGFSVAPRKRYQPARAGSDFDIALISADRFDHYWDDVFEYAQIDSAWKSTPEYKEFARMLFNGWIDPRGLPPIPRFERARRWVDFFDELMRSRRFGRRRISARLYRSWRRLEAYQEKSIRACRDELRSTNQ